MVFIKIDNVIEMEIVSPFNDEYIYNLVEQNRKYLSEYLTWVEETTNSNVVWESTKRSLDVFSKKKGIGYVIKCNNEIVGRISMWISNEKTNAYEIGYWIIERESRKGIVTKCVKEIMRIGLKYFNAEKFEIVCVSENIGSNRVPQKLGFTLEGRRRMAMKVNNITYDMNQYGILKSECEDFI